MAFVITKPINDHKIDAIASINKLAGEKITARLPSWKQNNLTARAIELLDRKPTRTSPEQTEWAAIQIEWDWVKSVRDASNVATEEVASAIDVVSIRASEAAFKVALDTL